jgi:hypothetical protein
MNILIHRKGRVNADYQFQAESPPRVNDLISIRGHETLRVISVQWFLEFRSAPVGLASDFHVVVLTEPL